MLIPFENLNPEARLWVYVADRAFADHEAQTIKNSLENFLQGWQAHGQDLQAGLAVKENRLVLIGVDETVAAASGCSIDASVGQLRELEKALGLRLLEQGKTVFRKAASKQLEALPLGKLKEAVKQGEIQQETPIINTWATRKGDWEQASEQMAQQTWLKRYF